MYSDLGRPPLNPAALRRSLVCPGSFWRDLTVVSVTGSTNADLAAAARAGAPEGSVLVAEAQESGRGREGREWVSPPRAGLTFSVLLRPTGVPVARWGWLSLLAGVALTRAVGRLGAVDAWLKWPNDLLLGPDRRKGAGLLAEVANGGVVVGIGLNVTTLAEELPRPDATSLRLEGAACTDRGPLLQAVLRELEHDYTAWRAAEGDPEVSGLRRVYAESCDTIGRYVRVQLPGDAVLAGEAVGVDADGRLVVRPDRGGADVAVAAGDVVHVRPGPTPS
ncbi:MAG TPA: biotin--[acetyl-CoA-carboxylase] ligase [Mycobacteriales bacterium]|jgi:BirA family biotin operon repressor/biotin-[acetyl-CoA-carboxylase] ligase|nr:biotin/acetyl-CoA-carboxylase ligase [Cryptosporangiaceae bacterium]MDQ1678548.1 BirA family transcriptional regulator [Actinomycetota bacterium]HEV7755424.1 biotin--[acetyl-CoA-carboxylase] ligase [Mycobacteriales bacterium]